MLSSLLLLLGSCKDPCDDLNCNAGSCVEGICNCDEGYDGTNCESEVRAKYYGTWKGPNMCTTTFDFIELDSVTLIIAESDQGLDYLSMELAVTGTFDVPLPAENAELIGNAFKTGPTMVDIGGSIFTASSDGFFRSDSQMDLDFVVSGEFMNFPISFNCEAVLVKQ